MSKIARAVGASLLVAALAALATASAEVVWLDTHEAPSDGFAGPVQTTEALVPGAFYFAQVQGTYSAWRPSEWGQFCGTPETVPMFPSPGTANAQVGIDAETIF